MANKTIESTQLKTETIISFSVDNNFNTNIQIDGVISIGVVVLFVGFVIFRTIVSFRFKNFEINEAEFGIGKQKIKLKPNNIDMQIAYKIWIELSTRKIGIPIDFENDVVSQIYDSWHGFFAVTRELIKDVPVSKFRRKNTEAIIQISIDVLNIGLRPHLTLWQAKFRRWYDKELNKDENSNLSPQEIQKKFSEYDLLITDLKTVNDNLVQYRNKMHELITCK